MKSRFSPKDIEKISKDISNNIFKSKIESQTLLFVCGADVKNLTSARSIISLQLKNKKNIEILYPERLFDELLIGQSENSLLDLESILANSVDAIILFPESPGSLAELGAFSSNAELCNRLICVVDSKYEKDRSFINHGPLRLIKKSKYGKCIFFEYSKMTDVTEVEGLVKSIITKVKLIKTNNSPVRSLANIFDSEYFVLISCYLVGSVYYDELEALFRAGTLNNDKISRLSIKASIYSLIKKRLLKKNIDMFELSETGLIYLSSQILETDLKRLDKSRIEVLNCVLRKKARYNNVY